MASYKTLRSYQSLLEAEGARSYLEAHGVKAQLPDRYSLYQQPHLVGIMGGARLQVHEDQFEEADELLQKIERRSHLTSLEMPEEETTEALDELQKQRQKTALRWLTRFLVLFIVIYWLFQWAPF